MISIISAFAKATTDRCYYSQNSQLYEKTNLDFDFDSGSDCGGSFDLLLTKANTAK